MAAVNAEPTAACTAAMMVSRLGGPGAGGGGGGISWSLWVGVVVKSMVAVGTLWLATIGSTHILKEVLVNVLALLGDEDLSREGGGLSRVAADLSRAEPVLSCDRAADLLRVKMGALPRMVALLALGEGDGATAAAVFVGVDMGDFGFAAVGTLTKQMLVSLLALGVLIARVRFTAVLASRWKYVGHSGIGSGSTASALALLKSDSWSKV
jgi:hypothetical protein